MKHIFTIVFVMATVFSALGQESNLRMRLNISPSITKLYGQEHISNYGAKAGFAVGVDFEREYKPNFYILSGVSYALKGMISEYPVYYEDGAKNVKFRSNFNYLIIPFLAKFTNVKNNLYLETGPYFGYLVSQIDHALYSDLIFNHSDEIKRFDIGWSLGVGILFPLDDDLTFQLGIKENLGLLNLSKHELYPAGTIKTNALEINFGLIF